MKNVFNQVDAETLIRRINNLRPETKQLWGKMSVAQMLAHLNVTYEMVYEEKHPRPNAFVKFILRKLVKNKVVNETPFKQNGRTAPQFIINNDKDFETEKSRLISYIQKTQQLGQSHFEGQESHSFGPLTSREWNNMFYKHLDHHLKQFGV
ncbi:DUF1569 domain-containing protein [Pontibacter sp. MBLB2868]|uniref:DUF1569 domain-containing protein n=1 Tax=Pontibacter sp. MBLB2868 TaxID=3451555 RepID=UPI003F74D913